MPGRLVTRMFEVVSRFASSTPRAAKSASCAVISARSTPRRVRSARTPTEVTPAIGRRAPPGTVSSASNDRAVPTSSGSNAPTVRPGW